MMEMIDLEKGRFSWAFVLLFLVFFLLALPATAQQDQDALEQYRQGNYARAAEITLAEIQQNPNRIDAYVVLGWSMLALGNYSEAASWGEQALRISRFDYRVLHILAEAFSMLGNDEKTIKYAQDYLAINPEGRLSVQMYYYLGNAFRRIGEYHHADIAFSTALHYSPGEASWWVLLGNVREQAQRFSAAEEAYRQALLLQPQNSEAQQGLRRISLQS